MANSKTKANTQPTKKPLPRLGRQKSTKEVLSFSLKACEFQTTNNEAYDCFQIGYANMSSNKYSKAQLMPFKHAILSAEDYESGIETGKVQYLKRCDELHVGPASKVLDVLEQQAQMDIDLPPTSDTKRNSASSVPKHEIVIDLSHYGLGNSGAMALAEMFRVNTRVTTLLINRNDIHNFGAKILCDGLTANSHTALAILDLSHNTLDIAHDTNKVETGFSSNEKFTFGNGFDISKLDSIVTPQILDGNKPGSDEKIAAIDNDMDSDAAPSSQELVNATFATSMGCLLANNSSITELNLSNCNLKDEDFRWISQGLERNTRLQKLNMSKNDITDVSCKYLTGMLVENVTLLILDMSWNRISSDGVIILMAGLKENTGLKELNLAWCGIDDKAARLLSEFVESHDYIESLDISNNVLGSTMGQCLINHLNGSSLKKIDVSNNPFGNQVTLDLYDALNDSSINEKIFDGTEMAAILQTVQKDSQYYDEQIKEIIANSQAAQDAQFQTMVEESRAMDEAKEDPKKKKKK